MLETIGTLLLMFIGMFGVLSGARGLYRNWRDRQEWDQLRLGLILWEELRTGSWGYTANQRAVHDAVKRAYSNGHYHR